MTTNVNYLDKYGNKWTKSIQTRELTNLDECQVIQQAGPSYIYQKPGYSLSHNHVLVDTVITTRPGSYQYKINEDPNPIRLVRPISPANLKQNIRLRYLEPPPLPEPNPIIIKERQLTPPPPAPPIVIRQFAKPPPTPAPLIIREKPPQKPEMAKTTIIEKIIPPPTPPPRQVILERIPAPERPREIIYEKWLPYQPQPERPVIVEKAKLHPKLPPPKNIIIDYEQKTNVDTLVVDEGIIKADPSKLIILEDPNAELRLVDEIKDLPLVSARSRSPNKLITYRATTPKPVLTVSTSSIPKGPALFSGQWNTTYSSSFSARNFGYK